MHDRQKSGKHGLGGVHTHWCAEPNRPHWYGAGLIHELIPLDKLLRPRRGRQLHSTESTEDCNPSHHASVRIDNFLPLITGENWWTPSQLEPKEGYAESAATCHKGNTLREDSNMQQTTWEDHFRETVFSIFSDPENGSILKHRPIWIIRKILCV